MSDTDTDFDPGPPPVSDFTVDLGEDEIADFHQRGFTWIERITTDEELEWLRPIYDYLFEGGRGAFRGGYFDLSRPYESEGPDLVPQVLAPEHRFPQLLDTTLHRNGHRIATQLLSVASTDIKSWSHMILKPPRVGGELPWHQDEAYWDEGYRYRALGCWVPLDPATLESGCMEFLPGSNNGPVRRHRHINDDATTHGLLTDDVAGEPAIAVPLAPGGASFHHCRTLHRSLPNVSDHVRRAWANEYQISRVKLGPDETPDRPWVRDYREAWAQRQAFQED